MDLLSLKIKKVQNEIGKIQGLSKIQKLGTIVLIISLLNAAYTHNFFSL